MYAPIVADKPQKMLVRINSALKIYFRQLTLKVLTHGKLPLLLFLYNKNFKSHKKAAPVEKCTKSHSS